ncbi:MAG TPA: nucleotidyltransferase domain-containing protein, partial [Solirubrobacteraceae bacterium]
MGAEELARLGQRFDHPGVVAIALLGSHARGDPNPYSDVDLLCLAAGAPARSDSGSHLVEGRLVVVTDAAPSDVEGWFEEPELALANIPGLRGGRALRDRDAVFAELQARARCFVWDAAMQAKADRYASRALVGWAEEVHKALAGLSSGDPSKLLDAEFGLSWGLNRLVQVQRGVPLAAPSGASAGWFDAVEQAVGPDSDWARTRRLAFGLARSPHGPAPTLRERVVAGLR